MNELALECESAANVHMWINEKKYVALSVGQMGFAIGALFSGQPVRSSQFILGFAVFELFKHWSGRKSIAVYYANRAKVIRNDTPTRSAYEHHLEMKGLIDRRAPFVFQWMLERERKKLA